MQLTSMKPGEACVVRLSSMKSGEACVVQLSSMDYGMAARFYWRQTRNRLLQEWNLEPSTGASDSCR